MSKKFSRLHLPLDVTHAKKNFFCGTFFEQVDEQKIFPDINFQPECSLVGSSLCRTRHTSAHDVTHTKNFCGTWIAPVDQHSKKKFSQTSTFNSHGQAHIVQQARTRQARMDKQTRCDPYKKIFAELGSHRLISTPKKFFQPSTLCCKSTHGQASTHPTRSTLTWTSEQQASKHPTRSTLAWTNKRASTRQGALSHGQASSKQASTRALSHGQASTHGQASKHAWTSTHSRMDKQANSV